MNTRLVLTILLLACANLRSEEPIQVTSYFGKGFGRLFKVNCRVFEIGPAKDGTKGGETRPVYFLALKPGVEATEENLAKTIRIQFWTPEVEKEFMEAFRRDPKQRINLIGYENIQGSGEPALGEKGLGGGYLVQGVSWSIQRYFQYVG